MKKIFSMGGRGSSRKEIVGKRIVFYYRQSWMPFWGIGLFPVSPVKCVWTAEGCEQVPVLWRLTDKQCDARLNEKESNWETTAEFQERDY